MAEVVQFSGGILSPGGALGFLERWLSNQYVLDHDHIAKYSASREKPQLRLRDRMRLVQRGTPSELQPLNA